MEEIVNVDKGINHIAQKAIELFQKNSRMVKVFIAGGSASGKSTGAKKLEAHLVRLGYKVLYISADDYYKGGRVVKVLYEKFGIWFDDPGAVDLEWLKDDVILLTNNKPIRQKRYEFGEEPAKETGLELDPPQILIVEGLFVLRDELRDLADIKVFFDIGPHGFMLRRIFRDTVRTGQKPKDILEYCAKVVEPKYRQWVLGTRQYADIVIVNEYDPQVEAKNAKKIEHQVKYKTETTEADMIYLLLKLGADRIAFTQQVDTYYSPFGRSLNQTGESMRIRDESGRKIWTYKGPKLNGSSAAMVDRPKYEFEISEETMRAFLVIYGTRIKVIRKTRTIFHLGSIVIAVDNVRRIQNGTEDNLGIFVEFRINSRKVNDKQWSDINSVAKKIGLDTKNAEKRSYVEM